jgi:hypothetical protein
MGAAKRVYLFDEAHRMSKDAQDILLKPIEDDRMVAMLCTTEVDKIRSTILSRCEPYAIRKVTREDILERMHKVLTAEGVEFVDDAVLTVIDHCGGHVRDVLNKMEMIAQMGAINLDNVREYLHLGVVTLFYDLLLAIGDSARAIELVDQACDRTSPEDVAAGVAEAAMNSYRLANNMHTEFVYVDREKAAKVWERLGPKCLDLADYFLGIRFANPIALSCAVVRLGNGVPATPVAGPGPVPLIVAPPAPPPPVPPAPVVAAPGAAVEPAASPTPQPPPPVVAAPVMAAAPVVQVEAPKSNGVHKLGALGSGDPMALTELDLKAVPASRPRRPNGGEVIPIVFKGKGESDLDPLTPEEWRSEFIRTWPGLR